MPGFSGLSGAMEGYQSAEGTDQTNRFKRAQATEATNDQLGQVAFGKALQLMFGGGGAQPPPTPGGGAGGPPQMAGGPPQPPLDIPNAAPAGDATKPYYGDVTLGSRPPEGPVGPSGLTSPTPMASQAAPAFGQVMQGQGGQGGPPQVPGQMSPQPMGPGAPPMQPPGGPGGAPPGAPPGAPQPPPMPPGGPGGAPPGAPPMQPPMPPGGPPGGQPGPQGQGKPALTLESVMQAMIRANPGAKPEVIAAGVNRFLPLMNAQSQMQWREISLALREQTLQNAMTRFAEGEERRNRQGDERTQDRRTGLNIRQQGEERRGVESTSRQQTATARTDLATRREDRQDRQGDERSADRSKRTEIMGAREERQAKESEERLKLLREKLTAAEADRATKKLQADAKLKKLSADAEAAVGRKNIQEARLKMQAMHQRSAELINEWALSGKIDPKVKAAVLEENRLLYRKMIEDLGKPPADKTEAAPGDTRKPDATTTAPKPLRINPGSGAVEELPAGAQ